MPKLYSSNEIIKVLQKQGFVYVSQKGSHAKFRKTGSPTLTVIIPAGKNKCSSSNNYHVAPNYFSAHRCLL